MEIKKKNVGAMLVGEWNTKTIVAVAIGAALFGVLMCYGGIPIFTLIYAALGAASHALFGPLPAMVCCGVGNVIADLIGGWGLWFDWSVGNAVMAFCVGLLPVYGANIKEGIFTVKHAVIYAVCCILGNMVAFGVITPIFSALFYGSDLNLTFLQALAATLGNTLVLVVVGIPILLVLANRYKSRTNLKEDKGDQY